MVEVCLLDESEAIMNSNKIARRWMRGRRRLHVQHNRPTD